MVGSALLSALHVLALAIGLPGVFLRGRALRAMEKNPEAIAQAFLADNAWGLAALLWLATGLTRAFGGFEKGSGYYLHSGTFLLKMALFGLVLLLELWPMVTLIRWRIARSKGQPLDTRRAGTLARINTLELVLIVAMPFVAAMMARGIGFTWLS